MHTIARTVRTEGIHQRCCRQRCSDTLTCLLQGMPRRERSRTHCQSCEHERSTSAFSPTLARFSSVFWFVLQSELQTKNVKVNTACAGLLIMPLFAVQSCQNTGTHPPHYHHPCAHRAHRWAEGAEFKGLLSKNKKYEVQSVDMISPRLPKLPPQDVGEQPVLP